MELTQVQNNLQKNTLIISTKVWLKNSVHNTDRQPHHTLSIS